jgi:predicted N-acetyltransferase YhbS
MIEGRELSRDEITGIWAIDRSEVIEAVYSLSDGALVLKREHHDVDGWPPGEAAKYTPILEACYDEGGWFYGLFDHSVPVGVAVLASRFIGKNKDQLQLKFLHVSRKDRGQGLGKRLFDLAANEARQRGAGRLYISATPSEHTISFYLHLGCHVTPEPDSELFALEPDDIHLEYTLEPQAVGTKRFSH